MDEERYAQFLGFRQHRPQVGMIEVPVARSAAKQRALQAQFANRPFQFARRCVRVRRGQGGEALETVRMARACFGDQIVDALRHLDRGLGGKIVEPGRGQRQHLDIHALRVHQVQPAFAEVGKASSILAAVGDGGDWIVRGWRGSPRVADERREDMLFDRDQAHALSHLAGHDPDRTSG